MPSRPDHGRGGEGAEVVEEAIRPLINEIRSSVSYYTSGHPDQMVSQLALVGGASQLPGLPNACRTC